MVKMFHFKHSDGGITFCGYDTEKKIFSRQYYANVGICNAEESKHVKFSEVKKITADCVALGYKEVAYLKREDLNDEK